MLDIGSLLEYWRAVPEVAPYIHPFDASELDRAGIDLERLGVFPSLFPQPWVGPIKTAKVFLLQLNPGFSGPEVEIERSNRDFQVALRENLDGDLPNLFLDDRFSSHPGRRWVESHLRGVASKDSLATIVAQLEIFPYHSKNFAMPGRAKRTLLNLPSVKIMQRWVRDILLPATLDEQVAIVVQRSSKLWGFTAGDESRSVVVYRGAECQGGWITSNTRGGHLIMRYTAT
jgi:hypothetical protein